MLADRTAVIRKAALLGLEAPDAAALADDCRRRGLCVKTLATLLRVIVWDTDQTIGYLRGMLAEARDRAGYREYAGALSRTLLGWVREIDGDVYPLIL